MPISQYPPIAPPAIAIDAFFPGASAETVENTVTQVIEQKMTGLDELTEQGWDDHLVDAIQSILNGERDEAALCEPLDSENAAVIHAILDGIAGAA